LTPLVRILALEITNHLGHHADPYRPLYRLEPDAALPRPPHVVLCLAAAFVPPLRFAMIQPRLHDRDARHATPRARALAREAKRATGWEDRGPEPATPRKCWAA
jgi:hypothetical protein